MLTPEHIRENEVLRELSDDQVAAITTLVTNNENKVIAEKTRNFWDGIDADIKAASGKEKPATMKSFDFLKETLSGTIKEANEIRESYNAAQLQITELEKSLKENSGDKALNAKITDQENVILKLRKDLEAKDKEAATKIKEAQDENIDLRFSNNFNSALMGLKFKEGIPEISINSTLEAAKKEVRALGVPVFDKGEITFKDEKELTITDPANLQSPLTAKAKFLSIIKPIIQEKREQTGGGADQGGGLSESDYLDFSNVKTQNDALGVIDTYLAAKGESRGTQTYQEAKNKLWQDNGVSALPMQ